MPAFLPAALLLAAATPAETYFTAAALQRRCRETAEQSVSACFAFVAGVYDTSRAYQQWMNFKEFCTPAALPQGDLRDATLRYLDLHPTEGDAQAASVVVLALRLRYPCIAPVAPPAARPSANKPAIIPKR